MLGFLKIYLAVFFAASALMAQGYAFNVTFTVKTDGLTDSESVYISGNHQLLGSWDPGALALKNKGNGIWQKTFSFPAGESLEFKFTKGAWQKEAIYEDGDVPGNFSFKVQSDTVFSVTVEKWKNEIISARASHGQITGTVKYHFGLQSGSLLPRDLIVWLPPGYEDEPNRRYPVLYMQDGQNIIDPETSSFGVDWRADETADSLIRAGEIEPIIIVGINNTSERGLDYTYSEKGFEYEDLVIEKIMPLINSEYRTLTGRENTAVAGSSLGGLISFMFIWDNPNIFSKAACFSPAFEIEAIDYISVIEESIKPDEHVKIYIDNGGAGLDEQLQPGVDDMLELLEEKGFELGKDLFYVSDETAAHNEAAWAKRLHIPLKIFFGK